MPGTPVQTVRNADISLGNRGGLSDELTDTLSRQWERRQDAREHVAPGVALLQEVRRQRE